MRTKLDRNLAHSERAMRSLRESIDNTDLIVRNNATRARAMAQAPLKPQSWRRHCEARQRSRHGRYPSPAFACCCPSVPVLRPVML
jgi:hypothetical protein